MGAVAFTKFIEDYDRDWRIASRRPADRFSKSRNRRGNSRHGTIRLRTLPNWEFKHSNCHFGRNSLHNSANMSWLER
jgi:hypothetical protein